jgi:hypothetical protein
MSNVSRDASRASSPSSSSPNVGNARSSAEAVIIADDEARVAQQTALVHDDEDGEEDNAVGGLADDADDEVRLEVNFEGDASLADLKATDPYVPARSASYQPYSIPDLPVRVAPPKRSKRYQAQQPLKKTTHTQKQAFAGKYYWSRYVRSWQRQQRGNVEPTTVPFWIFFEVTPNAMFADIQFEKKKRKREMQSNKVSADLCFTLNKSPL